MKVRTENLYIAGITLLFPVIICGQLIWLFDPLRLPNGAYLIDYIHVLVSAVSFIPLLWTFGALRGLWMRRLSPLRVGLRIIIMFVSAASAGLILINPREIIGLGIFIMAAFVLIFVDLSISERSRRGKFPWRTGIGLLTALLVLGVLLWPTKYLVLYPGMTMNMNRYVQADGGHAEQSLTGVLVFQRPASPIDWLYARMFPHYTFSLREDLGMSLGEYHHIVQVMRQDADTIASAVALEKLGIGAGAVSQGALTAAVFQDGPAHGYLLPGDVIKQVDQHAVQSADDLLHALQSKKPGETIQLMVLRDKQLERIEMMTAEHPDDPERVMLGIQVMNDLHYDVPLEIGFHKYLLHEGGPSHGAMLTLAIIDQLTPGGVIGDYHVAGTGTIAADGSIGSIGGIKQKAYTVERSGAEVFFVPEAQAEEARAVTDKMIVVPVNHIDDILHWLMEQSNEEEETTSWHSG